jgi:hypothetical protein
VLADTAPPQVTISAPQAGAAGAALTFLVAGRATDDVSVVNLVATVDDPLLGRTVNQAPVSPRRRAELRRAERPGE